MHIAALKPFLKTQNHDLDWFCEGVFQSTHKKIMKVYAISYRGSVPNQHKSLSRTWQLGELRTILSDDLLSSLNELEDTIKVNLWDVGIGGSRILEDEDYISIVCKDNIYTARIIAMIDDHEGLIGDTVGWSKLGGRPWVSPFFLEKTVITKRNYYDTTDFLDRSSEGNSGGLYVFSSEQKVKELFDYVGYKMDNKQQKKVTSDANKGQSSTPIMDLNRIHRIIKDYRAEDNDGIGMVDENRIEKWVNQFENKEKNFILTETENILRKRYFARSKVEKKILGAFKTMAKMNDSNGDIKSFISNSIFLDMQPSGKSQGILLDIIRSLITGKYNVIIQTSSLDNLNSQQAENYIYFDDVLCTGNTFYQDIKEFLNTKDESGIKFYNNLIEGNARLHCCFIFLHDFNASKKRKQLGHHVFQNIGYHDNFNLYAQNIIENEVIGTSNLQILKPLENQNNNKVTNYKNKINEKVENYISNRFFSREDYYRTNDIPQNEEFFTTPENRIRYENIILLKGIEILENSVTSKPNIRALGYSLPSIKDFGFGTLCFTWRNVPNNTPLVFWYSHGGFTPLFPKRDSTGILTKDISEFFYQ